jgi:site-specific DNA-methyltransferase (adenine-specific)/modification methylase
MGSGTTAIAAIRSGRHYIGFETDAAYCRIAGDRIKAEKLTETENENNNINNENNA